jgi:signal transduction histidine kinase
MAAPAHPAFTRQSTGRSSPVRELNGKAAQEDLQSPTRAANERLVELKGVRPEEGERAVAESNNHRTPDNAPEVSVRAVSALLLYFERQYGRERLESLWRSERFGLSLTYVRTPTNFVSLSFLESLCNALVRETADSGFCRSAGLFTATPEAIGFAFYFLKAFGSPRICYEKMIELSTTYNRVGAFTVEQIDDRHLTFSYCSRQPEQNRNICELRMGQFAGFPTVWNLPPANVSELQCQVMGAECCRYEVKWQRPILSWRRYVGALAGVAAGVLIGLTGILPLFASIPIFAMLVGFAGAWLDARHELRLKDGYLLSQNEGMAASARDLQLRYEEVYRANVELEQRVADRTSEISEAKDHLQLANQKLEQSLDRQRELDRQKTQFFDNVSHELRTPLTLILLSLEAVIKNNRTGVPAWIRQYLETIERSSMRLLRLINDLLDLAKLESGKARLRYESIEFGCFLKALLLPFQVAADQKRIRLTLDAPELTPVLADAEKIEDVFQNLVSNALKFTPEGGSVAVRATEDAQGINVEISDTGIGIASQDLSVIFDRFAQADSSGIRRFGGTGIGLAVVKETVELHGGEISVSSTLGEGSCFRVTLPKGTAHIREELRERRSEDIPVWRERRSAAVDAASMLRPRLAVESNGEAVFDGETDSAQLGKRTLLIVEDDPAMRRFLVNILRQRYSVVEASNGKEALDLARRKPPDLVLSDVVMPVMSGLQLTQALKASADTADIPVVLLTAQGAPDNAADGLSSGANDYVPKPFSPRELLARVETQLRLHDAALAVAENERLAALGLLTSGFAHEVRNPLNGLLNALEPLQATLGADASAEVEPLIRIISECGNRINRLSESLLTFARPQQSSGPVDIASSLDSALQVLGWRTRATVTIEKSYKCREPVLGDATTLNQVWLNLLDNALRAIGDSGTIAITTDRVKNDFIVTIRDSGCGIPEDKLRHIFEPFFSTRAGGEGAGLGLALCRRIVLKHGGQIRASSEPGKGTSFEVSLPLPQLGQSGHPKESLRLQRLS